jgi:L-asparaginase
LRNEVLIIPTGGTVVSVSRGNGLSPDFQKTSDILDKTRLYFDADSISIRICRIFGDSGYDSSDMGPSQWVELTRAVKEGLASGAKGILILHGTDTMAYTSAWLSLCFDNTADIPIVITGSQRAPDSHDYDGEHNIHGSAEFIKRGIPGVWLFFHGKAYRGDKVHKSDAQNLDAYSGEVFDGHISPDNILNPRKPYWAGYEVPDLSFIDNIALSLQRKDIACLRIVPGLETGASGDESILIIEGYGAGNMPQRLHAEIDEIYRGRKKPQIIACSQAEHGIKDPTAYSGVGIGELSHRGFTVWSQGDYPMEFICALTHLAMLISPDNPGQVLEKYLNICRKA